MIFRHLWSSVWFSIWRCVVYYTVYTRANRRKRVFACIVKCNYNIISHSSAIDIIECAPKTAPHQISIHKIVVCTMWWGHTGLTTTAIYFWDFSYIESSYFALVSFTRQTFKNQLERTSVNRTNYTLMLMLMLMCVPGKLCFTFIDFGLSRTNFESFFSI